MGRLEKQIMIGALALVGVLVAVVILKGLAPHDDPTLDPTAGSDWSGDTPALMLDANGQPIVTPPAALTDSGAELASDPLAQPPTGAGDPPVVDLGATPTQPPLDAQPDALLPMDPTVTPAAAPVEVPTAAPAVLEKSSYVVKGGDTLGHIAQRELGSVRYTSEILKLNPGLDANNLKVGATLQMPMRSELPALPPKAETAAKSDAGSATPTGASSGTTHVVAAGDTLWSIAVKYLGDGSRSGEIVAANPDKLKSKDSMLKIGMKLRIPKR